MALGVGVCMWDHSQCVKAVRTTLAGIDTMRQTQAEVGYGKALCRCEMQLGCISLPREDRGGTEEAV